MTTSSALRQAAAVEGLPLTEAHLDILDKVMQGMKSPEIAASRGTSLRTVEIQVSQLKGRLGARTIAHAVAKYLQEEPDASMLQSNNAEQKETQE